MMETSHARQSDERQDTEHLPVIDAYLQLESSVADLGIDITDQVVRAHSAFAMDEPYNDLAPHSSDRWHLFLNYGLQALENVRDQQDPVETIAELLDAFIE